MENNIPKLIGCRKSSTKREIYSDKHLNTYTQKKGSFQINNLEVYLKELGKKTAKPKVSRRKEITKIRVELNEMGTRKTIGKKSTKLSCFFEKINESGKCLASITKKKKEILK